MSANCGSGRLAGCGYPVIEHDANCRLVSGSAITRLVFGFGEWIPAGNAADSRGQFATDVEPAFSRFIERLRRLRCRTGVQAFQVWLFQAHFMARRVPTLNFSHTMMPVIDEGAPKNLYDE